MKIALTRGLSAIIDDQDEPFISPFKWMAIGRPGKEYAGRNAPVVNGMRNPPIYMHRLIMGAPAGMVVDHINGDTLDNRRSNLRVCEHRLNIAASRSHTGSSPYKGVTFDKSRGKWTAQIRVNYRNSRLGRFTTDVEAARAYDIAAREAWGEFAILNFPSRIEAEAH